MNAFWTYCFTRVEPISRRTNPIAQHLDKIYDREKNTGKPIKKMRANIRSKATEILYKKLVSAVR
ncbi:MAG: hypothetical protein F6K22_14410 [Okeania sp. SIO2F4]|uniref:hypothetical protein n=1 Tax=Okeania sp. SIO2F4 TaxID=2607790 RepID=UPI00142CAF4D|nr:hypothetical protein [Okeania sp. SIO2F4]NES03930.1 hypothetical protein [Okeania sp. SIO2F4]